MWKASKEKEMIRKVENRRMKGCECFKEEKERESGGDRSGGPEGAAGSPPRLPPRPLHADVPAGGEADRGTPFCQ